MKDLEAEIAEIKERVPEKAALLDLLLRVVCHAKDEIERGYGSYQLLKSIIDLYGSKVDCKDWHR